MLNDIYFFEYFRLSKSLIMSGAIIQENLRKLTKISICSVRKWSPCPRTLWVLHVNSAKLSFTEMLRLLLSIWFWNMDKICLKGMISYSNVEFVDQGLFLTVNVNLRLIALGTRKRLLVDLVVPPVLALQDPAPGLDLIHPDVMTEVWARVGVLQEVEVRVGL